MTLRATDGAPTVRLMPSPFLDNALRERAFMESLDPRALTRMFRVTSALATLEDDTLTLRMLGGWEAPDMEIRGHTCGHWLSGMASLYEMTGDETVKERAAKVVDILAKCQAANANGYLGAFPESDIDKIIRGERVWAPWYVLHKILAGLLDQYMCCGNAEALEVARRFGDWVAAKVLPLSEEQRLTMLKREFGGIGDSLYTLYSITHDERHRRAAEAFYDHSVMNPLDERRDALNGRHANTFIPKVIADVRAGNFERAIFFWDTVIGHYMYAPGCVSTKESFRGPDRQADFLTGVTGETCCTYNLLKLSRLLFDHADGDDEKARYADYQERALWNHILGQMEPIDGHLTYFMPVMTGSYKLQSRSNDSFWCCCGSAMESHTRYHRMVCREVGDELYINNYIPSEIKWKGLTMRLETNFPEEESARLVVVDGEAIATIAVRRPFWTTGSEASTYERHTKRWGKGDTIEIPLKCQFRTENAGEHRAVFYGPILMAARLGIEGISKDALRSTNYFSHDYKVPEHLQSIAFEAPATWKRLPPPPAPERGMDGASPESAPDYAAPSFVAPSGRIWAPFWAIHGERYAIYTE